MGTPICYLRCVENLQKRIQLPHLQTIHVGRNEESGICDLHVSRNHLSLTADCLSRKITLQTLGRTYSGCNGFALQQDSTYNLKDGDRIEVRLGFHPFDVVFEDIENNSEDPPKKKTKLNFPLFTEASKTKSVCSAVSGKWQEVDGKELLIYTSDKCEPQRKIAGFDLDGTLIKTESGARFPKNSKDWTFNYGNIRQKLHNLHTDGYKIVVFTNQGGLKNDETKIKQMKEKIVAIITKFDLPMQVFIATNYTIYRKPAPGMWKVLTDNYNDGINVEISHSFFVGDAAGREKNWSPNKNKDHSTADRLFAINLDLRFYTPEEYFLNEKQSAFTMPEFDPRVPLTGVYPKIPTTVPNVILLVGGPGSGKSFYCKSQIIPNGYVHISRDKLGTWQKCAKLLEECIRKQQNVVIDNTNPDKKSRERFLDIAKRNGINCNCFVMSTSFKHALHNNRFREITDKSHLPIARPVLYGFKNTYQEPDVSEGFEQVVKVPFLPTFNNPEHENLYKMFLVES